MGEKAYTHLIKRKEKKKENFVVNANKDLELLKEV